MLGFSEFLNLISDIERSDLIAAVQPEIVKYAEHKFVEIGPSDAYRQIFEKAFRATGGEGNFPALDWENAVSEMRKKRSGTDELRGNVRHAQWFYYFALFSSECTDPHYGERISLRLFGQSFFDTFAKDMRRLNIPRPKHLPPLKAVDLGPITISFDYQEGLKTLFLQEPTDTNLKVDGQVGVFRALDWRSRLTSLHGRKAEYDRLLDWASGGDPNQVKIMLVSGPGGSGKTRLVADVVDHLVNRRGWAGGFLPKVVHSGDVIDGSGNGAVLIIDYPEERVELVKGLLTAASDEANPAKPVRIILASRENTSSWARILNSPYAHGIEELRIGASPYLEKDDALQIVEDVFDDYPVRIGVAKSPFHGVEDWLDTHPTHRLPLFTIAASIHAVLEPKKGFTLSGQDVLITLAKIERRRVRSYSNRDLGEAKALEKLLALASFTSNGLSKSTIIELGNAEICDGKTGVGLLEAVQNTPFWTKKTSSEIKQLHGLEPDRPATAMLYLALDLHDPSPALTRWLAIVVAQEGEGFGSILARIAFDLSHNNSMASKNIEEAVTDMLDQFPQLAERLSGLAYQPPSAFSADVSAKVCKMLLASRVGDEERALLMTNAANILLELGRGEEALEAAQKSTQIYERLEAEQPGSFLPEFARSLHNLANAFLSVGKLEAAKFPTTKAAEIYGQLAAMQSGVFQPEQGASLNNQSILFAGLGEYDEALIAAESAVSIRKVLAEIDPSKYQSDYSVSLHNLANRYSDLGHLEEALASAERAVLLDRVLAKGRPELFSPNLAGSLNNVSNRLSDLDRPKEALEAVEEAVEVYRQLAELRPDRFSANLAGTLVNLANASSELGRDELSLKALQEATTILRELSAKEPCRFQPNLAGTLNNLANTLLDFGRYQQALEFAEEAVVEYRELTLLRPQVFTPQLAMASNTLALVFSRIHRSQEAVDCAREAIVILKQSFHEHPLRYSGWMKIMVNNYVKRCSELGMEPDQELVQPLFEKF